MSFKVLGGDGRRVTIEDATGAEFDADAEGWLGIASRLWAAAREERDRFCAHFNGYTEYPDCDRLHVLVLRNCAPEAMALATALCAAGHTEEGQLLAHLVFNRAEALGGVRHESVDVTTLSKLSVEAARGARYQRRRPFIDLTTNLGVVKAMADSSDLEHEDPRVRREGVETLAMATFAAAKPEKVIPVAATTLLARLEEERSALVRECVAVGLEMTAVKCTVAAEGGDAYLYDSLDAVASALIRFGSNVDLNRVRRIEALYGLGREEQSTELEAALLEDIRDVDQCPGPYVNRPRFLDFGAAALGARIRALGARTKSLSRDELSAKRGALRTELEAQRAAAHCPRPDLDELSRYL
ncbi:MAG: hypothetical protein AAF658_16835 [Myxococcota bacterium]